MGRTCSTHAVLTSNILCFEVCTLLTTHRYTGTLYYNGISVKAQLDSLLVCGSVLKPRAEMITLVALKSVSAPC
jgi:hypothetical protein